MALRLKLAAQALALVLVAGLLGLLGWKLTHQEGREFLDDLADNEQPVAPSFALPRLDRGGTLDLGSLRGKVVVLNFWATWCGPCREELPRLQDAWVRYRNEDVVFIGVNTQDFKGDARGALRRYGMTYPNVYDAAGRVIARYGGIPLPKTFFVSPDGRIVGYYYGALDDEELKRQITRARGKPA